MACSPLKLDGSWLATPSITKFLKYITINCALRIRQRPGFALDLLILSRNFISEPKCLDGETNKSQNWCVNLRSDPNTKEVNLRWFIWTWHCCNLGGCNRRIFHFSRNLKNLKKRLFSHFVYVRFYNFSVVVFQFESAELFFTFFSRKKVEKRLFLRKAVDFFLCDVVTTSWESSLSDSTVIKWNFATFCLLFSIPKNIPRCI